MTAASKGQRTENREQRKGSGLLLCSLLALLCSLCSAVETPPRLFFSDAQLSFLVPEPWDVPTSFPSGPLLTRKTQEGTDAFILCQISDPVKSNRLSADVSTDVLKAFAANDLRARMENSRVLASSTRTLVGQNAYEITWLSEGSEGVMQSQSIYFYMESRFYVLSLHAHRDSFPWIVQDFQEWLTSVHRLSREESGKLAAPAHGGLWVHQTGSVKIGFPEEWLVGVADDHQVGATMARDKMHLDFTVAVEVFRSPPKEINKAEKATARQTLGQKSYSITAESDEPFHGLPCFRLSYEGTLDGRFVRGQDLWVAGPRALFLISLEGDGAFFRQSADQWQRILNNIQFL
jgi:hypothetical protein